MNAIVKTPTQLSKEAIENLIAGKSALSEDQARKVWLVLMNLTMTAMHAEHAAFYVIEQNALNNAEGSKDFDEIMRRHLGEIKQQLICIGGLLRGEAN